MWRSNVIGVQRRISFRDVLYHFPQYDLTHFADCGMRAPNLRCSECYRTPITLPVQPRAKLHYPLGLPVPRIDLHYYLNPSQLSRPLFSTVPSSDHFHLKTKRNACIFFFRHPSEVGLVGPGLFKAPLPSTKLDQQIIRARAAPI